MFNKVLRKLAFSPQLLDKASSPRPVTALVALTHTRCLSSLNTIDVVELSNSGHVIKSSKTPEDFRMIKETTGLPVRDLRLFFSDGGGGFLPSVLARPSSNCFLLHLDSLRLLCLRDKCMVMEPNNALVQAFAKEVAEQLKEEEEEEDRLSDQSSKMVIYRY